MFPKRHASAYILRVRDVILFGHRILELVIKSGWCLRVDMILMDGAFTRKGANGDRDMQKRTLIGGQSCSLRVTEMPVRAEGQGSLSCSTTVCPR